MAKGDKLFFRVRPQDNGVKKKVVWDPAVLPFSQSLSRTAYLDENHRIFGGGNKASESQLLQGDSLFFCPAQGNITIESVIRPLASVLTDDICFEIWYENDRIYQYTIAAGQNTSLQTYTTSFSVDTMDKLRFKVVCRSNVNMHELQWYPRVYYNYLNYGNETIDAVILDEENNSVRMLEYVIAPWHDFYHHTTNLSNNCLNKVYDTPPTLQPVTRSLSKLYILSGTSGSAYITIKQDGALLFAQEMSFSAGYTNAIPAISNITIIDDPNKPVYISFYVNDPSIASGITKSYVVIDGYRYHGIVYTKHSHHVLFGEWYGGWGSVPFYAFLFASNIPCRESKK